MSDTMWYVAVDGQTVGPMSEAELVDALQAGTYGPNRREPMVQILRCTARE
jgi:hypothetical protein